MISFIYITCRKNPKLELFINTLYQQVFDLNFDITKIQLVIVDFELQYDTSRLENFGKIINNRFDYVHVEPKPSKYQGKHKLTKVNYFSASGPRNTGVCYSKYDYLVFIDDLSAMGPNSFSHIVDYANKKIVVGFSYQKVNGLEFNNNKLYFKEHSSGIDSRIQNKDFFRQIQGAQLYGYNASPLYEILKVNGYDEICASMGGEDYHYGHRLQLAGVKIYYSEHVRFYESEYDEGNGITSVFIRRDPLLEKEKYLYLLKKYNVDKRHVNEGRYDLSHLVLDILMQRDKSWTEGNNYHLTDLRNKIINGGQFDLTDSDYSIEEIHLSEL